jgi:hypothetical protein
VIDLARFQADTARALAAPEGEACPPWLQGDDRRRFRVYRNNVRHGLAEALEAAYPATARLVGTDFFRAMAQVFVTQETRRSRSLALFGGGFPAFVAAFPPAASVRYLADVARLERAVLEAQHEADARPLDPDVLLQLGDRLVAARFVRHPAARLVPSPHPVVAIWQAQRRAAASTSVPAMAQTALVTRPFDEVLVQSLPPAVGAFAEALLQGGTPTSAWAAAEAVDPAFDPHSGWQALLQGGALAGASTEAA